MLKRAAAAADGLVPIGDDRLDKMMAGGFRAGELCGLYGEFDTDIDEVRRVLWYIVRNSSIVAGPVLYFALNSAAEAARLKIAAHLGEAAKSRIVTPAVRNYNTSELREQAELYARESPILMVVDQLDAVSPLYFDSSQWDHEAQVTRDLKLLSRILALPILTICTPVMPDGPTRRRHDHRALPLDRLVENADILLRTNGRLTNMVKNRHGITNLW